MALDQGLHTFPSRLFSAVFVAIFLSAAAISAPAQAQQAERVVALGGTVTEIVFALGQGDRLIARDSTSSHPAEAQALPNVGYVRALSPEGVLSVDPDLILATEGSGPPETMDVLNGAAVPIVTVSEGYDADAILKKIRVIAEALDVAAEGERLANDVSAKMTQAVAAARSDAPPRVLFILSLQGGRILAAGEDTAAEGIIALSGGVNAMDGFTGYKQVSDEAILLAAPEVILMMDRAGGHAAANSEIIAHPVLGQTPAAASEAIVRQPGLLLLGFGPRTPDVILTLSDAFDQARG